MIKRGVEFGLGLAGTIISGLGAVACLIGSILLGIAVSYMGAADWFAYPYYAGQDGFTDLGYLILSILAVVLLVVAIVMTFVLAASFVLGLIGVFGLRKRQNEAAKKEGILLIISGCLGNVLTLTSGIVALGKNPDRILYNKPDNRKMEFALGLSGSILIGLGMLGQIFYQVSYTNSLSMLFGDFAGYGYYPVKSLFSFFSIVIIAIFMGGALALSLIGTIRIRNKRGMDNVKTEGILLLIGGILAMNPLSLAAGILALTKRENQSM